MRTKNNPTGPYYNVAGIRMVMTPGISHPHFGEAPTLTERLSDYVAVFDKALGKLAPILVESVNHRAAAAKGILALRLYDARKRLHDAESMMLAPLMLPRLTTARLLGNWDEFSRLAALYHDGFEPSRRHIRPIL